MNIISHIIYTLEENCFIVYGILFLIFVYLTIFHTRIVRVNQNIGQTPEIPLKVKKYVANKWEKDFPDDEDPGMLLSAIPEDTPHIAYKPIRRSNDEVLERSRDFYNLMAQRRTVRMFSSEPVPQEVLDNIIKTAGTAPSGAHTEPWTFVVVQDATTKAAIREIVEEEEELNYSKRMSRQWVTDLKPFATRSVKPYLTEAPALILVFRQTHSLRPDGRKRMHYYSEISLAVAAGFILAAVHYCGLVALTSTPLNCHARLRALLSRPANEKLELLFPVGRPHKDATVPDLSRKPLDEILVRF